MNILVINCGSSSLKYQLIDSESEKVLAKGLCERIGIDGRLTYSPDGGEKEVTDAPMPTHTEAIQLVLDALTNEKTGVIKSLDEVGAVGHRVVHGGEKFAASTILTDEVLATVEECNELAPLHNPANLIGINACKELMPDTPMVGVFDTAFHQTMPKKAYLYGLPIEYYDKYKIRRYGFHGTSYQYILGRLEEILGKKKEDINAIVCHLGGGASVCAIKNGKSYDTSMGFTPLEGLVMETRCGDIDASIVLKIMKDNNYTPEQMDEILNKKSGRLGLCGIGDQRQMIQAEREGNEQAKLARKIQTHRNKKYIGAYMAELNRVDAIVFTGGNGENNACEREDMVSDMECLGIELDKDLNNVSSGKEAKISKDSSKVLPSFTL